MLRNIDEDEKVVITTNSNPPLNERTVLQTNTSYSFLTENGLYEVLMLSRKPKAKEFKKKVKEILKTIRKTGGYINQGQEDLFIEIHLVPTSHLQYSYIIKIRRRNRHEKESQKISYHSFCCYHDILTSTFSISGN